MAGLLENLLGGIGGPATPVAGPPLTRLNRTGASPVDNAAAPADIPGLSTNTPGVAQISLSLPTLLPSSLPAPPILVGASSATTASITTTTPTGAGSAPTLPSTPPNAASTTSTSATSAPTSSFLTTTRTSSSSGVVSSVAATPTADALPTAIAQSSDEIASTGPNASSTPNMKVAPNQKSGNSLSDNPAMMALVISIPVAAITLIAITMVLWRGGCLRCGKARKRAIIKDEMEHEAWQKIHQEKFGPSANY